MATYDPAEYEAVITAQGFGNSAVKRTPYWGLTVRIQSRRGPDGRPRPCPQSERDLRFHVRDEDTSMLEAALEVLGLTGDQIDPASPSFTDLIGRRIAVRCVLKPFHGEAREEWRLTRPAGVATAAAATITARLAARRSGTPPADPPSD